MSDTNRSKMIPLHVCDQAVAACNREIDKLQEENSGLRAAVESHERVDNLTIARLKAEVERLSSPAIVGGYNLSEYIRMANSETLEFDNGDIFAGMTLPERIKYIVDSHAQLKAEIERMTKTYIDPASILRLIENGMQKENGFYVTNFTVEVNRDAFEHLSQTMMSYWKAIREGKQP